MLPVIDVREVSGVIYIKSITQEVYLSHRLFFFFNANQNFPPLQFFFFFFRVEKFVIFIELLIKIQSSRDIQGHPHTILVYLYLVYTYCLQSFFFFFDYPAYNHLGVKKSLYSH